VEPSRIFLIGYRGSGKSAVARKLALRLGYDCLDSDRLVEARAGKSITAIFADDGENAFRDLEAAVVAELCGHERAVVALGGGAVLREANRQAIAAAGPVVWLTASIETLLDRIRRDPATAVNRPNLTAAGGRGEMEAVLAERTPIYQGSATLQVDTEGKTTDQIADEILRQLAPGR
jgi:shikimate kinase